MDSSGAKLTPKLQMGFYPGNISRSPVDNHYPGCRTKFFWTVSGYNRFFQEVPGEDAKAYIVVENIPVPYCLGLFVGVLATYTKQLTPEQESDLQWATRELDLKMSERVAARELAAMEDAKVRELAMQEQARLALIGKKYEDRVGEARKAPTLAQQSELMDILQKGGGDPEVLFGNKLEAFQAGYVKGYESGKEGDK